MAVIVTEDCIGCGACVDTCPEGFAMDDTTGRAKPLDPNAPCVDEAMDICPVEAIVRE